MSDTNVLHTRRDLIKLLGASAASLALPRAGLAAASDLSWLVWDANAKPEYLTAFKQQSGIDLKTTYMTSDDTQFASLKSGAATTWDVLNPSINGITRYIDANLLQPLDLAKIPNAKLMYDAFKNSPRVRKGGKTFAIPYLWGLNPIVYRADKFSAEPDYATLFDARYKGQLAMRDYPLEAIAIAGIYIGVPRDKVFTMGDKELAEAKKALIAQKPLLRTYWQNIGDLTNLFATGEVTCAFSWRPPYDELKGKLKMGMAKPKAGVMGWCDCFALPTKLDPEKVDAAYKLINYLLGPDYAQTIALKGNYATTSSVVRDKLSRETQESIFIDNLDLMKGFMWPVAPPNYSQWLKLWTEVKAS